MKILAREQEKGTSTNKEQHFGIPIRVFAWVARSRSKKGERHAARFQ